MPRSTTWPTGLVVVITIPSLVGCSSGPPPDEGQFTQVVAQMLVEAAERSGGVVDGDDPVKTIVFEETSIPLSHDDLETVVKQSLDDVGIAWIDTDLQGDPLNLPGEWTTIGRDSTRKFNRTHSVVRVSIEGDGQEREVRWGLVCGPACGYGQRVRLKWSGDTWGQTIVARNRY